MISMNLMSIIDILNIKDSSYQYIISLISKNEAATLTRNADFTKQA